jgi:Tfp pilus assembly protein PilN
MSIINLLPRDYVKRRLDRRADMLLLALFGIVMLGVISATILSERSWRHTVRVAERVNESYVEATKLIEQLQQLQVEKENMLQKAEQTASLMERVPRSYLLATTTNALPQEACLTSFHLTVDKVEQKPGPPRGAPGPAGAAGQPTAKFQAVSARRFAAAVTTQVNMEVTGLAGTDVDVAEFIANMQANPLVESADLVYSEERLAEKDIPVRGFQVNIRLKPGADVAEAMGTDGGAASDAAEAPEAERS